MYTTYKIQPNGFRTIYSDGSSNFASNTGAKSRPQIFAGPLSVGLIDSVNNIAFPNSVQFGTGASDIIANTAFTAVPPNTTSSGMETGGSSALPCLITTESNGDQHLGFQRVYWKQQTKILELSQYADDALVTSNPRVQVWGHRLIHKNSYYRFFLNFKLGNSFVPWAPYITNKNTILIFQLKGAASYPLFDVQVRDAASGDVTKRDLYFLRRLANTNVGGFDNQGQDRVLVVSDISLDSFYNFCIDYLPDYTSRNNGGKASIVIYKNNIKQTLHSDVGGGQEVLDNTLYSATPDYVQPMWGIYRLNYSSAKAPNNCGITFKEAGTITSSLPFNPPNNYIPRQ